MSSEKLTGYIDVAIGKGKENGLIFLINGKNMGGSYGAPSPSKKNQDLLIQKTNESGGSFNVCRIPLKNMKTETEPNFEKPDQIGATLAMLEELLRIFEKVVGLRTKKRTDFQDFMNDVVKEYPDQEIHCILDNSCIHKRTDDWLKQHPNVNFHDTPTSASWLNQVEIWFGIFSRKVLRGSSHTKESLKEAIEKYIVAYNKSPTPFVWRKREVRGSQIADNIANLRN